MNDTDPAQLDTAATIAAFLNLSTSHVRRMSRLHQMPSSRWAAAASGLIAPKSLGRLRKEEKARPLRRQANDSHAGGVSHTQTPRSDQL